MAPIVGNINGDRELTGLRWRIPVILRNEGRNRDLAERAMPEAKAKALQRPLPGDELMLLRSPKGVD